jgi:hypothetical protein
MKKLLTFFFLFLGIGLFAQVLNDSTAMLNFGGNDLMKILTENMWVIGFVAFAILEKWLGNTGKVKQNSVIDVILNLLKSIFKKKAGKATVIIVSIFFLGNGFLNAQNKFSGFFRPIDEVVQNKTIERGGEITNHELIFRPAVVINAYALNLSEKSPVSTSFQSAGLGLSYGDYSTVNDKAYCNYSVNALIMTGITIGDNTKANIGFGLTFDVFDKFIGVGAAFIDKDFYLMLPISISF